MRRIVSALLLGGAGVMAALAAGGCSRPEPPAPRTFERARPAAAASERAAASASGRTATPPRHSAPTTSISSDVEEARAVIQVDGMACQGCANAAAQAASRAPGCVSARGSFEDGVVVVRYRPDLTTPEAIAAAITNTDRGEAPPFSARVPSP